MIPENQHRYNGKSRRKVLTVPIACTFTRLRNADDVVYRRSIDVKNQKKPKRPAQNSFTIAKEITSRDVSYENLFDENISLQSITPLTFDFIDIDKHQFAGDYIINLIETEINSVILNFAQESCIEITNASLSLYSNIILNQIVSTVLANMTPSIAKEAQVEVINSEYVGIRNLIITEVLEEELFSINQTETLEILADYFMNQILTDFKIKRYIKQSITEEINQNEKIVVIAFDDILTSFVDSEWLEELAEEELVMVKIEEVRKTLPAHVQKEIFLRDKKIIYEKVAELLYFDILNEYVGGVWTNGLVKSIFNRQSNDSELSDSEIFLTRTKSLSLMNFKRSFTSRAQTFILKI